jgi:uncharacterized repeat protein (TIGR01451 family)/gliding motility-associated-like protein
MPYLDSVGCYGESITMEVIVVEYLSLHTMDDIFYTYTNESVSGDVSLNDSDETNANIYYTGTLVDSTEHGTVELNSDGSFVYTPDEDYVGVDYFTYEAFNDNDYPMYSNATVTIVVQGSASTADLYIEKTGPEKALYGGNIEYTILVKNLGPSTAYNVVVKDTLAFGLFDAEYSIDGDVYDWGNSITIDEIAAGDSVVIYIYADISDFSPGYIYNQALTYSDTWDSNNLNNDSIWVTEILTLYVDLPGQIVVASCETMELPGDNSEGNNDIASYLWTPGTGLSDSTIANPIFTPDEETIGKTNLYVLQITDVDGSVAIDSIYVVVTEIPVAQIEADTVFKDLDVNRIVTAFESSGAGTTLSYLWSTVNGKIIGYRNTDSIEIATTGIYYLRLTDGSGCEAYDSVVVLLESHLPVMENDSVTIVAGTDSTINVLDNDYDINGFDLEVTSIVTPPNHSTYTWDASGSFTIQPEATYWQIDSIEYKVCNNGYPVACSTAWIIIDCERPPLNADMEIQKTGDLIDFFGDTIFYDITVSNNGPDTATNVLITDIVNSGLFSPEYSLDDGLSWLDWYDTYTYDSILPEDVIRIKIKAFIRPNADSVIENTAWLETEIIENNLENDTASWTTKIKVAVVADAGLDTIIGSCSEYQLDASASTGNSLSYSWYPATHLSSSSAEQPTFSNPEVEGDYTYRLIVTDDDDISDTAYVTISVLAPPLADAGGDQSIELGDIIGLDGKSGSSGSIETYLWTTYDGNIIGSSNASTAVIDTIGHYTLTVTDVAGCTDTDEAWVYWFYYPPFAIPDYYSTSIGTKLTGNLLYNDYEPNKQFNLSIVAETLNTTLGGTVVIAADGSFTYTPPTGASNTIDGFSYQVCNDADPVGCSYGYVVITIALSTTEANLTITKEVVNTEALIGDEYGVQFKLTIQNKGTVVAKDVILIDSLSEYLIDAQYQLNSGSWYDWSGNRSLGNIAVDEVVEVGIRATATSDAPALIFNAATVASDVYDSQFDWDDVLVRNVDTASVLIISDLLAKAELVEMKVGDNLYDITIGSCDDVSYLTAENSSSILGIDSYEWTPHEMVTSPYASKTTFTHVYSDTVITFTLTVISGSNISTASIDVYFSPEVIADAGPDRKINDGETLVIDATNSQGAEAVYTWTTVEGSAITSYLDDNELQPIIESTGIYRLSVYDMHGCYDVDTVVVRENDLFAVNDFVVVLSNDSIVGNVGTNDYDPNDDLVSFDSVVFQSPQHGYLVEDPLLSGNKIGADGSFTYHTDADYTGFDWFSYAVYDDNDPSLSRSGVVYINVIDPEVDNTPPVANPDYFFVNKNDTLSSNVLANDYDYNGGNITMSDIVTNPVKGKITFDTDGDITYIPYTDEVGADRFVYQVCDSGTPSECDTVQVIVYIHKLSDENHHPVAVDDAFYVVENAITGNVLLNDYDPDGDQYSLITMPVSDPEHGTFTLRSTGDFTYLPDEGYEGTDQVIYQICETKTEEQYCTYATIYLTSIAETRYTTDVAIVKTAPSEILSGSTIEYTLTTTIIGPSLANDIIVTDTLFTELTNYRYSLDNGLTWETWNYSDSVSQLFLYDELVVLIRADIPDVFSGTLVNTASVSHDMNETDSDNNTSDVSTIVYQKVIANAGSDTVIGACIEDYMLNGTLSVGMGDLQYSWTPSDLLDNPSSATPLFSTEPSQTQEFMLVVSSSYNGYDDADTSYVTITVAQAPTADAGSDIWPEDDTPVELDGSGSNGVGPLSYLWWYYDDADNVVELSTSVTFEVSSSGDYYLTVTDTLGCTDTDLMHVGYPVDDFIAVDDEIETYQQTSVDIYILRNDLIDEEDEYNLDLLILLTSPSNGVLTQSPYDSMFTYTPDPYFYGVDTFTYIATTQYFNDQATVIINVVEKPAIVPGGFSPNGDGINDYLIIENADLYPDNTFVVFNRWGNIVCEINNYTNSEPWDGIANKGITIGSGPVPTGVYLYIFNPGTDSRITDHTEYRGNIYVASDN